MKERVAIFAQADNWHTHRWARRLADLGCSVALFSDSLPRPEMNYEGVSIVSPRWSLPLKFKVFKLQGGPYANNWHKWQAYQAEVKKFAPTITAAMEARAYGPMLKHFEDYPRVLIPWGTDMRCLDPHDLAKDRQEECRLVRQAVDAADAITANAPGMEEHWHAITGIPRDRFVLAAWGIDSSIFRMDREGMKSEGIRLMQVDGDRRILLSPRLAQKNYHVEEIMRAWSAAKGARTGEAFVVLRAGADAACWQRIVEVKGALGDDDITLIDRYFTPRELAAIYNAASGFVMYPDADLLALSLIEGAACGCIPIIRNLPSYHAFVQKGPCYITSGEGATELALKEMMMRWLGLSAGEVESGRHKNAEIALNFDWLSTSAQITPRVFDIARKNCEMRKAAHHSFQ
ncbi:glycosyltransferase [Candidatus Sumerlaeota bacterium]|nr:glycosyltransferase [Candidatus Sumerlaeota bacterium]